MGGKNSILSQEQLDEYVQLTYLNKSEIVYIFKKFSKLGIEEISQDIQYRFSVAEVMEIFPELKYNPFREQLFWVFSSMKDGHYSFEDILDLASVMSENCPLKVKSNWAFKVFDFNGDNQISKDDLFKAIDLITRNNLLEFEEKNTIADVILQEVDLITTGGMSELEFQHTISKMPEFANAFYFKI